MAWTAVAVCKLGITGSLQCIDRQYLRASGKVPLVSTTCHQGEGCNTTTQGLPEKEGK